MKPSIKFEIKEEKDIFSIMIYRPYEKNPDETKWSYIDSCHPMSKMDLHMLKNFLQEYLNNNDWY